MSGKRELPYDREHVAEQCVFLANRIRRNREHLAKWLRREGITCYRIYDTDIPEIPLAIDVYEDALHIAEYRTFTPPDPALHEERMRELCLAAAAAVGIGPENIFYKIRQRQRGSAQYGRVDDSGHRKIVHEGGLSFAVNLADYLDTGLFLDHRPTRAMVRALASGKSVLNLFAYTGSFSIYALAGGATRVTTVDLSNTYLDWVEDNHLLNFPDPARHEIVRADALEFARGLGAAEYDIIVADPPTFSVSKAMDESFDIQRDHAPFVRDLLRALKPGGTLFFSTNRQRFELDPELSSLARVSDISEATVPKDFRNRHIHSCWTLVREA